MDALTLGLSLIIFAGLFWLHRREVTRAYAAGQEAERTSRAQAERHGLAALPATDYDTVATDHSHS